MMTELTKTARLVRGMVDAVKIPITAKMRLGWDDNNLTAPDLARVLEAIGEVLGLAPQYVVSPGTYDQKHIDRIGRMHNCIAYGPGILDLAHQPDEWIGIDDMVDAGKVMALTLLELLGGKP
jgi:acetylornithine deacetylase/succinyl-diaminopimelate desuccinylase-like protein